MTTLTTVINRTKEQKDVPVVLADGSEHLVFIQPKGAVKLEEGATVPQEFQTLNPQISVIVPVAPEIVSA